MNKIVLLFLIFFKVTTLFAGECSTDLEQILARFETTSNNADLLLDDLDTSIQISRTHISNRLSEIEVKLQERFLNDYEQVEKKLRKATPVQLENAGKQLDLTDKTIKFGKRLVTYVDGLEIQIHEVENLIYSFKKLISNKSAYRPTYDLAQELLELQMTHAEHSLYKILDDWNKFLRSENGIDLHESLSHLTHRLDDLDKETHQHFFNAKEKIELLNQKVTRDEVNLIVEHGQFIKNKSEIPIDVRIKAVEFEIDLALTLDRNSLSEFGHDKVTTFASAKRQSKIPNHIQFWHYHLKRGSHDHVIIWAMNKHDHKQTFYPLWVGAHGRAPYMGDKNFTNWMRGKLNFLGYNP